MIYYPAPYPQGDWEAADLVHEDAWFQSEDGTRLHGWFCPAQNPRAVVLYTHGNGGQSVRLYTPSEWGGGSSYSHPDEDTYPAGDINSLMTPFTASAESIHAMYLSNASSIGTPTISGTE